VAQGEGPEFKPEYRQVNGNIIEIQELIFPVLESVLFIYCMCTNFELPVYSLTSIYFSLVIAKVSLWLATASSSRVFSFQSCSFWVDMDSISFYDFSTFNLWDNEGKTREISSCLSLSNEK
jgi:hypothetical protein